MINKYKKKIIIFQDIARLAASENQEERDEGFKRYGQEKIIESKEDTELFKKIYKQEKLLSGRVKNFYY